MLMKRIRRIFFKVMFPSWYKKQCNYTVIHIIITNPSLIQRVFIKWAIQLRKLKLITKNIIRDSFYPTHNITGYIQYIAESLTVLRFNTFTNSRNQYTKKPPTPSFQNTNPHFPSRFFLFLGRKISKVTDLTFGRIPPRYVLSNLKGRISIRWVYIDITESEPSRGELWDLPPGALAVTLPNIHLTITWGVRARVHWLVRGAHVTLIEFFLLGWVLKWR